MKTSKKLKIKLYITNQNVKESLVISELIYSAILPIGITLGALGRKAEAFKLVSQVHRSSRLPFLRNLALPAIKKSMSAHFH